MGSRAAAILLLVLHAAVLAGALISSLAPLAAVSSDPRTTTPAPWLDLIKDVPRWQALLGNTLVVVAVAVAVSLAVGTALAAVVFRIDARFRGLMVPLLFLAAAFPFYLSSAAVLAVIGIEPWRGAPLAAGLVHAVAHLPVATLVIGVALRSVHPDLEETAMIDGAGTLRTLLSVTLPVASGGLVAAMVIVALWASTEYLVSDMLLLRTFAEEVYTQYALQPRTAALVCVPQALFFAAALVALRRRFLGTEPFTADESPCERPRRLAAGRGRTPLSLAAGAAVLALAMNPIVSMAVPVRTVNRFVFHARSFVPEILTSLGAAAAAAVLTTFVAVGLAWFLVRRRHWRRFLVASVVILLAVPAPVLGMGMIRVFNHGGPLRYVYDSPAILVLAYTFRFLPLATILLVPAVRAIPEERELAAKMDGCGAVGVWRHILWPACAPTAVATLFAVMVLSIGELPCSLLVTPPGVETIGARFFGLLHTGFEADLAALGLCAVAAVAAPWILLTRLLRRRLFA